MRLGKPGAFLLGAAMSLPDEIFEDANRKLADEAVFKAMEDWVTQGGDEVIMLSAMADFVNDVTEQFKKMQH